MTFPQITHNAIRCRGDHFHIFRGALPLKTAEMHEYFNVGGIHNIESLALPQPERVKVETWIRRFIGANPQHQILRVSKVYPWASDTVHPVILSLFSC
jgi:hypothetical protein